MTDSPSNHPFHRRIRSFVRREGRMTASQQRAMDEQWPIYGVDYQAQRLDLAELFGRDAPKVLEIGFGMGDSLAQMAAAHPEWDYFGIEVHRPGVGRLLMLREEQQLTNLRVSHHDAVEVLEQQIPPHSLDRVQLFFPDPWHKKRHHKRRIVQPQFIDLLAERLKPGGILHMATDWENYAEHMQAVMEPRDDFRNLAGAGHFSPRPESRPVTKFERRGERLGHGVWDLLYQRC